jgi:hypothetical protein
VNHCSFDEVVIVVCIGLKDGNDDEDGNISAKIFSNFVCRSVKI